MDFIDEIKPSFDYHFAGKTDNDAPARRKSKSKPAIASLGFFDDDETQNAENPCVLVVHYEFEEYGSMKRDGNQTDLNNLRDAFEFSRGCNFQDLCAPTRENLLKILGSEEEMKKFMKITDKEKVPSIFILIILSHGDKDGKILTNHLIKPLEKEDPIPERYSNKDFVSFTTIEVIDAIKSLDFIKDSLKIIFFGPCRGENVESLVGTPVDETPSTEFKNSCRIYCQPNENNFVIFFSTIESTVSRRDSSYGTWMVYSLHKELEAMDHNVDLEVVLTKMQRTVHDRTSYLCDGQTPEVKVFPHRKFTFKKHRDQIVSSKSDGIGDTKNVQGAERLDFYTWKDQNEVMLSRGQALIFYKVNNEKVTNLSTALSNLSYDVSSMALSDVEAIVKNVNEAVCDSGSIFVCFLAKISMRKNGIYEELTVDIGTETALPIQDITSLFVGPKCSKWIGKPKIFFFLDPRQDFDVSPDQKRPRYDFFSSVGTSHSGLYVMIGAGEDLIDTLTEELKDSRLKEGRTLQEATSQAERKAATSGAVVTQISSTLQFLVDFPDLENTFITPTVQREWSNANENVIEHIDFNNFRNSLLQDVFADEMMDTTSDLQFDGQGVRSHPQMIRPNRKLEPHIWLLSTPPGLGKTLMTKQLAKWVRSNLPDYMEFDVNLLQRMDYFSETEWEDLSVEDFLLLDKPRSKKEELKKKLGEKQVMVFLDGFEKICPAYQSPATILLKLLVQLEIPLWVTTRPEQESCLKEVMSSTERPVHLLRIRHLETDQQKQLLQIKLKNEGAVQRVVEKLETNGAVDLLQNPFHLSLVVDIEKNAVGGLDSCSLFSMYEQIIDSKVTDALVTKEGRSEDHRSFKGMFRQRKGLLVRMAVAHFFDGDFSKFSDQEIVQFNLVGIATILPNRSLDLPHEYFFNYLVTLEFLNRVRKAAVLGDEGVVLIAPQDYLLKAKFKQVRLFIESFLSEQKNWERYFSAKFIQKCNLNQPSIAEECRAVIQEESLNNLLIFVKEVAIESNNDLSISESIWMNEKIPE